MAYELMAVLNPKPDTDATAKKIEKFIEDAKAQNVKVEKLGRKELAYPITKQKEAGRSAKVTVKTVTSPKTAAKAKKTPVKKKDTKGVKAKTKVKGKKI